MGYVIAIVGLLLLICIHELGHFGAAKLVGMKATSFTIGFPPIIFGRQRGETTYRIGAIPLGGYVSIPGMLKPEPDDLYTVEALLERPGLDPVSGAALADAVDDFRLHLNRGRLEQATEALGRVRIGVEANRDAIAASDMKKIEKNLTRVEESLEPRSYWRSARWRRLVVILAGPAMNVLACFVILVGLFLTGVPQSNSKVSSILSPSPAATAGLHLGDKVIAVNGRKLTPDQAHNVIEASNGAKVRLTVDRGGRIVQLPAVHTKKIDGVYRLGFSFGVSTVSRSALESPRLAVGQMWGLTTGTLGALGNVVTPQGRAQLHSVVGITRYSAEAVDYGISSYLSILAFISLSLAIFNLLPFLPLDGGHVLMIALEKVRGRAVSRSAFERISAVGIVLMLMIFAIGLQNDIGGLIGNQPH